MIQVFFHILMVAILPDPVDPRHHHVGFRQLELVVRQSADLQKVPPQVAIRS